MPISVIFMIVSAVIEIIKLIMTLRKTNPVAAAQCSVALREARKSGDHTRLSQILDTLNAGKSCE